MNKSEIIKKALLRINNDIIQEIENHETEIKNLTIDLGLTIERYFYETIDKIELEKLRHNEHMLKLAKNKQTVRGICDHSEIKKDGVCPTCLRNFN